MKHNHKSDPLLHEEMPPVVRQGLQQLRETPSPDPAAWQAARTAFLASAQQLALERVSFTPIARRKGWVRRTLHALIPSFKEANPMIVLLKVALILSLMTGAGVGGVAAAQDSLPGSPLYPLKTAWENAQSALAIAPEARLEQALTMAQERVNEMQRLAEHNREIPTLVVERYTLHLNAAVQALGELPEALQEQTRARIQENLAQQEQVMQRVLTRLQQNAGAETPVREMAGILKRTRDRLQDPAGEPPTDRPPEPPRAPNPDATAPGPGEPGAGPGPNPTETTPGPGEPGAGPGEPGAGPGPNPTETTPGPGEPGAGPGEPGGGPGPNPTEPAPGPGEPGGGPGPTPTQPAPGPGEPGGGPGPTPTQPAPGSRHP